MAVSISKIKTRSAQALAKYYESKAKDRVAEMKSEPQYAGRSEAELLQLAREEQVVEEARLNNESPKKALDEAKEAWARQQTEGQTAYYAPEQGTDRSVWLRGSRAGEQVTGEQLEDLFLGQDGAHRLDDPAVHQLRSMARAAGYEGELNREALESFRQGFHPDTGEPLNEQAQLWHDEIYKAAGRKEDAVTSYDMTFSAPKAVSLIASFSSEETRDAIVAAQQEAVEHALAFAEENGVIAVRRGKGGAERLGAEVQSACTKHEVTSRNGDPSLHSHTLISAYVKGEDGRITTMDGQAFMGASATVNDVYLRALSQQLNEKVGITLAEREAQGKTRLAEVPGIPQELEAQYSTRRQQINEALNERLQERDRLEAVMGGRRNLYQNAFEAQQAGEPQTEKQQKMAKVYKDWLEAASNPQAATMATRSTKADETEAEAVQRWQSENTPDGEELLKAAQKESAKVQQNQEQQLDTESLHARMDEELVAQADKFSAAEAISAAYRLAPQGVDDAEVMQAAQEYLGNQAVQLEGAPEMSQTGDVWVSKQKGWTTQAVVQQRQEICEAAEAMAGQQVDHEIDAHLFAEVSNKLTLSPEQEQMLLRVASGQRMVTVQGLAGTGKSHADKALVRAIQKAGGEVTIMSTKADLAATLAAETGANRGMTLASAATKNGVFSTDRWAQGLSEEQIATYQRLDDQITAARAAGDEDALQKAEEEMNQWSATLPTAQDAKANAEARNRVETLDKAAKFSKQAGIPGAGDVRQGLHHKREELAAERDQQPDVKADMDQSKVHTIIVDEAAMSSDDHLQQLLEWAEEHRNVQVVLQGDFAQLGSVERGGAFRQILDHVDPVELREIRRAKHEWEQQTQARMHDLSWTQPEEAEAEAAELISTYEAHDRIHAAGTEDEIREAIEEGRVEAKDRNPEREIAAERAAQWYMDHQDEDAAVLVPTKHMQTQIAEKIQEQRKQLPEDDPQRLDPDAPKAQLNLGDEQNPLNQQVQAGEKVTIRENIHEKGLKNGQSGTVQSVRRDGSVLVSVENERGRQFNVRLSKDQLENGVAALRYTSTVHKSQGQTLERGLYVHDPSNGNVDRHLVYPAMTRGKESNEVLLVGDQDEAKQDLAHAMSRSDQDTLRVASHRAKNPQPDEEKVQQQVQEFAQEDIPVSEETVRESFYEEERRKADLGFKALIEQERKKVLTESRKAILRRREQKARHQETEREKIQRRRQAPRMQQKVA